MKSALKALMAAYDNPHQAVLEHRTDRSPVFGHLTDHVPLELLHAAGILPVKIQSGDAAGMASGHLQTFSCSFCRAAIHQEVSGDYHYLSGLVSSKTCDTALSLFQLWTYRRPMEFSWLLSLPGNREEEGTTTRDKGIPLMLLGGSFHDISIIDVIEKGGGRVMVDDTVAGGRSFGAPITHSADPLRSLARYYLSKATGPYRLEYEVRRDRVLELAREYGLRGCIHVVQKFCDSCLFEIPLLVGDLKAEGFPSLVLEIDDTAYSAGQVTTRIEAFLEML